MKVNDFLTEAKQKLVQEKLLYKKNELDPVMSEDTIYTMANLLKHTLQNTTKAKAIQIYGIANLHNVDFSSN